MSHELQKWLTQQLRYTEAMGKHDKNEENKALTEAAIAARLFYHFLESSLVGHARYAYDCILEHFPCLPNESLQADSEDVVLAFWECLSLA